jgi:hypothetical protein
MYGYNTLKTVTMLTFFVLPFDMAQGISIDDEAKVPTSEPFVATKYSSGEVFSVLFVFFDVFFLLSEFRVNKVILLINYSKAKAHSQMLS